MFVAVNGVWTKASDGGNAQLALEEGAAVAFAVTLGCPGVGVEMAQPERRANMFAFQTPRIVDSTPSDAEWTCAVCDSTNEGASANCDMCDEARVRIEELPGVWVTIRPHQVSPGGDAELAEGGESKGRWDEGRRREAKHRLEQRSRPRALV